MIKMTMPVTTTFQVRGMHCAGCAQRLQTALGRLNGVLSADPDHQAGQVAVRFDPEQLSTDDLTQRLAAAGFEAVGAAGEVRGNGNHAG
jgi:copper chaperone CopZ